jgi:hypothetical protein
MHSLIDWLAAQVDVEGYEAEVLRSGAALTASPRTRNILVEYSPGKRGSLAQLHGSNWPAQPCPAPDWVSDQSTV